MIAMPPGKPRHPFEQGVHLPADLLRDSTREPLRVILNPYRGITHVPPELGRGDPACMVFIELQKCFQRQGFVAEGLMANIIWAFGECGYDPRAVAAGLTALRKLGYVEYTAPDGNPVHELSFAPGPPIWIRYGRRFLDLLVREVVTP